MAQTNVLKDNICIYLPHTLGIYHSARHIAGTQRLWNRTKPICPSTRDQRQKHAPSLLLSFQCKWQMPGYSLVFGPQGSSFIHSLPSPHSPTPLPDETRSINSSTSCGYTISLSLYQSHNRVWNPPTHSVTGPLFHFSTTWKTREAICFVKCVGMCVAF